MKKTSLMGFAALLALVLAQPLTAQEQPSPQQLAEGATDTRQAVFKLLYFHLRPIVGMARGEVEFDAALAERNARRMAALGPMIPDLFSAMDTREYNVETEALPVIWEDAAGFREKAQALVDAASAFADTAAGGDQTATLGAVRSLGGSCGNCHDAFRVDDD